jgi:hypothetical protein
VTDPFAVAELRQLAQDADVSHLEMVSRTATAPEKMLP